MHRAKIRHKTNSSWEFGTLEVVFDTSGRNGMQTKTISVKSNATIQMVMLKNNNRSITIIIIINN